MPDSFGRAVKSSPLVLSSAGRGMSQGQDVGRLGKNSESFSSQQHEYNYNHLARNRWNRRGGNPRMQTVPASNDRLLIDDHHGENAGRLEKKMISWNKAVLVFGEGLNPLKEAAKSMPSKLKGVAHRRI